MPKYRKVSDFSNAAKRFVGDVERNSLKLYAMDDFQSGDLPSVFPTARMEKCTHAYVALSACEPDQRDYMVLCPYRVDQGEDGMDWDLDPIIIAFDSDTMEPDPTAVLGDHQDFEGRTLSIEGVEFMEVMDAASSLSANYVTEEMALDQIPEEFENAFHHMAKYYRKHILEM